MLFSIFSSALAIIIGASTVLADDPYKDACSYIVSYANIMYSPVSHFNYSIHTVSTGELCCQLCHFSELNCVAAQWQLHTEQCMIVTNARDIGARNTGKCPNGQFNEGQVGLHVKSWAGWIPGPCWLPLGMYKGVPGPVKNWEWGPGGD